MCSCCLTLTFHHLSSLVSIPHISSFLHRLPLSSSLGAVRPLRVRTYIIYSGRYVDGLGWTWV